MRRKWELFPMGIVVWKKLPLVAVNNIVSVGSLNKICFFYFIAILCDLTVVWLTRELACL